MTQPSPLSTLTEVNIDDLLNAWGLANLRLGRGLVRALARPPSARFAAQMLQFDVLVGREGLMAASQFLCRKYTGGVQASGVEHIPLAGPLLLLSNHPGLADTVALFSVIPRPDLKIIALDRPFLNALPHTAQKLFMLPDDPAARAGITREVARFLKGGGAALTFPAGHIEPDPRVLPGAVDSLQEWSPSIALFARLVPGLQIVVGIVSGVLTPAALHHPLTRLRRTPKDRELLGAALQLLWPGYQRNTVHVAFSPPIQAAALAPDAVLPAILSAAQSLIPLLPGAHSQIPQLPSCSVTQYPIPNTQLPPSPNYHLLPFFTHPLLHSSTFSPIPQFPSYQFPSCPVTQSLIAQLPNP